MATPVTKDAQQAIVGESDATTTPPVASTAKTVVSAIEAANTRKVLTDERGPYVIVRVKKADGTIARVKKRVSSTTDQPATTATATTVATPIDETSKLSVTKNPEVKITATSPKNGITSPATPANDAKPASQNTNKTASSSEKKNAATTVPTTVLSTTPSRSGNTRMAGNLLQRLGGSALTRGAAALMPGWDLEDLQDDDVPLDSDDDSDDYSDDDDDESRTSKGDEKGDTRSRGLNSGGSREEGGDEAMAAAARTGGTALLNGLGKQHISQIPLRTGLEKDKLAKPAELNEKTSTKVTTKTVEGPGIEINEKHINGGSETLEKPQQAREPQRVSKTSIFIRTIVWSVMIGFPLLFIGVGIAACFIRNHKVSDPHVVAMKKATSIAITAWPIVFAAIAAQSLKTLATWRVERGIRLMRLEQLLGSHSVASAIKQPLFLRRLDFVGIGLLLLWSLSPIASQALQKMLVPGPGTAVSTFPVYYVDTTGSNLAFGSDLSDTPDFIKPVNIMFLSALLPQTDVAPETDAYYSPIVPILKYLPSSAFGDDGWADTAGADPDHGYATAFGIPHETFPINLQNGVQAYTMSSSYFDVNCTNPDRVLWSDFLDLNMTFNRAESDTLWMSMTGDGNELNFALASVIPADTDTTGLNCSESDDDSYQTVEGCFNSSVAYSTCKFVRTYVDSMVDCSGDSSSSLVAGLGIATPCSISKMRLTPGTPGQFVNETLTSDLSKLLVSAEPLYSKGVSTVLERWLMDPYNALDVTGYEPVDISTLTQAAFTKVFGLLVNTYWQIGFSPIHVSGGVNHAMTGSYVETLNETTAQYTDTDPIYFLNVGWLAALFVCAFILLVAGIASAIFEALTVGPDVLGFASSIVRQSKHVRVPDSERGSSALSGPEQARMLGNVKVMMQDVRANREVGKIALGTINEDSERLQRGRLYR